MHVNKFPWMLLGQPVYAIQFAEFVTRNDRIPRKPAFYASN